MGKKIVEEEEEEEEEEEAKLEKAEKDTKSETDEDNDEYADDIIISDDDEESEQEESHADLGVNQMEEVGQEEDDEEEEEAEASDDEVDPATEEVLQEEVDIEGPRPPQFPPPQELRPSIALGRTLAALLPSQDFEAAARTALKSIEDLVQKIFGPRARVKPYGSLVQGSHLQGSDLDLCLDCPWLLEGLDQKKLHAAQVNALTRMSKQLPASFVVQETRFWWHVRVPILILEYTVASGEKIQVDISVGGFDFAGVEKGYVDLLIQGVFAQAPKALALVLLVKQWAKVEGLNKAFDGFLNPLGWTLLCLYFLMRRGEVLPEAFVRPPEGNLPCLAPPRAIAALTSLVPSTSELAEFFEDVASFQEWLPDSRTTQGGPRGISLLPFKEVQGSSGDKGAFYLEDPAARLVANKSENVARALKEDTWRLVLQRCRGAAKALRAGSAEAASAAWARRLLREAGGDVLAFSTGPARKAKADEETPKTPKQNPVPSSQLRQFLSQGRAKQRKERERKEQERKERERKDRDSQKKRKEKEQRRQEREQRHALREAKKLEKRTVFRPGVFRPSSLMQQQPLMQPQYMVFAVPPMMPRPIQPFAARPMTLPMQPVQALVPEGKRPLEAAQDREESKRAKVLQVRVPAPLKPGVVRPIPVAQGQAASHSSSLLPSTAKVHAPTPKPFFSEWPQPPPEPPPHLQQKPQTRPPLQPSPSPSLQKQPPKAQSTHQPKPKPELPQAKPQQHRQMVQPQHRPTSSQGVQYWTKPRQRTTWSL
mmetsp:Transcript_29189/g.52931  ORF Transcript_29189/g.52931 Transcript_29189/m.52931 type:complete len:767 (+) Transcript_29189:63-2363(+)